MGNHMIETIIGNTTIQHEADGTVNKVFIDGENLDDLISTGYRSIICRFNPYHPDTSEIDFPQEYKTIFQDIFEVINDLYNSNNACLAAYLSSFLFGKFTLYWIELMKAGRHIIGIQFWNKIISIVHRWEESNGKHIHKGSPYAFIAFTYLIQGNLDLGFSFIYNAVEEDIELGKICPSLNYPSNAPAYLTAILSSNPNNMFMGQFVAAIRSELEIYLSGYRAYFGRTLTLDQFDRKFLQNTALGTIRFYFVFIYWAIFEYQRKVVTKMMQNDFSKLKNASWLFALCLVIDNLLNYKYGTKYIGDGIKKYSVSKRLMAENDLNNLIGRERIAKGKPDIVIAKLLLWNLYINGSWVSNELQHLLIAYNLRNFASHNYTDAKCHRE